MVRGNGSCVGRDGGMEGGGIDEQCSRTGLAHRWEKKAVEVMRMIVGAKSSCARMTLPRGSVRCRLEGVKVSNSSAVWSSAAKVEWMSLMY